MNKIRRAELNRAVALIEDANAIIEQCKGEEETAFENLPEGIQASERGEQMEDYISALEDAISELEMVINSLVDDVIEG